MAKDRRNPSAKYPRRGRSVGPDDEAPSLPFAERLRPWLLGAVAALLVARTLFPSESPAEVGDDLPTIMLWLVLVVVWGAGAAVSRRWHMRFGPVDAVMLLLVLWYTFTGLRATVAGSPRAAVNSLWLWIGYGAAFLLVRQLIASRREARAAVVVMIGLAVGLAGYGFYQYFYDMPNTRAIYLANPDATIQAAGLSYPAGSPERAAFENRLFATEPIATFALTNSLAGYLVPWLAMGAGVAVCGWRGRSRWLTTLAATGSVVILAACLLLTKSRSGYVAALVGLPLAWWVCRQKQWRLNWKLVATVAAGVAVLVLLATAVGGLDSQVASEATKSLGYRFQYWRSTLAMVADHPFLGCGPGQFQAAYTKYKLPESSEEISDPHNFLLEIWATAGTPALLIFLAVLVLCAMVLLKARYTQTDSDDPSARSPLAKPPGKGPVSWEIPEVAIGLDASTFIVVGGFAGFLLALPLGLMSSSPPGLASLGIGLPLAALVSVLFWPWMRQGTMPALLPGVGAVALLVNLLAAGAMGFPGVIGSLWLLMALGLDLADTEEPYLVSKGVWRVGLAVVLATIIACYVTAYAPVLKRQASLQAAERDPQRAAEHLEDAIRADQLAVEPRVQLAAVTFQQWQQNPTAKSLQRFQDCQQATLWRAPLVNSLWADAGDRYWAVFQATKMPDMLEQAIDSYQQAVTLYPTNAGHRAALARVLYAKGELAPARREAEEAKRLHELTPHEDKKLPKSVLDELDQGPLRNTSGAG